MVSTKLYILQVEAPCCDKFIDSYEVAPGKQGFAMTMIEEFVKHARKLLRGTGDVERPEVSSVTSINTSHKYLRYTDCWQAAGSHGQRDKFSAFASALQNPLVLCSTFFVSDLSRKHSSGFHKVIFSRLTTYPTTCYLLLTACYLPLLLATHYSALTVFTSTL